MPVKLSSSGGGSVTLDTPSTASNYTVTLPTANTTLADTSSTQTLTNKTLTAAGSNSVEATSGPTSTQLAGQRNKIINGAMMIDQRNAGAAVGTSVNGYTLDRWTLLQSVTGKINGGQNYNSITPPVGFSNYIGIQSQSAYSVLAGDYYDLVQPIEGVNCADLSWGTANAKTITLSFQVYSSLTGTFGGAVLNSGANRSYPFTYSIPVANTWTQIAVTIPGDTSGTWLTTTGVGVYLRFGLGVGSTYSGTAGAWASANYASATGATSVVGTNGATFYITGVQLEKGATATPFENRLYGTELALCQRYYAKSYAQNVVPGSNAGATCCEQGLNGTDGNQVQGVTWPVVMRAAPTTSLWSLAGTAWSLSGTNETNSNINNGSWNFYAVGDRRSRAVVGTGGLGGGTAYLYHWAASAEL